MNNQLHPMFQYLTNSFIESSRQEAEQFRKDEAVKQKRKFKLRLKPRGEIIRRYVRIDLYPTR